MSAEAHALLVDTTENATVLEAAEYLIRGASSAYNGSFAVTPADFYRLARAVVRERMEEELEVGEVRT